MEFVRTFGYSRAECIFGAFGRRRGTTRGILSMTAGAGAGAAAADDGAQESRVNVVKTLRKGRRVFRKGRSRMRGAAGGRRAGWGVCFGGSRARD